MVCRALGNESNNDTGAGAAIAHSHADSESGTTLFCPRVWSGVRARNYPHSLGCPTCRHEDGRTHGDAHHARGHHRGRVVDSSTPRGAVRAVLPPRDGLHRARPHARRGIWVRAVASGSVYQRLSRYVQCRVVTILHRGAELLEGFDPVLVEQLTQSTRKLGANVQLRTEVNGIEKIGNRLLVRASSNGEQHDFEADLVVHGAGPH